MNALGISPFCGYSIGNIGLVFVNWKINVYPHVSQYKNAQRSLCCHYICQ